MRRNVRELPRAAWLLVAGNFINWFASFAITFLALYLTRRGLSFAQAGAAVAAYGAGDLAAGTFAGHLADRIGRRTTMALSMFGGGAAVMGLYYVDDYRAILAVAFLAGVATETWRPASRALMSDVVPEGQRVTAFAMVRLAGHLGLAGGGVVAGFLADRSFFWVFLSDAATSAAFGLIALTALPQGQRIARREEIAAGTGYRRMLSDRPFLWLLAATVLVTFVYSQQQAALPLHVVRVSGLANFDFGRLLALNAVMIALLELPLSSVTMRRPAKEMIALGFLLVGVGFGLTAVSHTFPALALTVAVWTLGEMVAAPVGYAYVADLAPRELRGRYQGLYGLSFGLGGVTGPAVGALLFSRSVAGLWLLCGALGALSAGLALLSRPARAPAPPAAAEAALAPDPVHPVEPLPPAPGGPVDGHSPEAR